MVYCFTTVKLGILSTLYIFQKCTEFKKCTELRVSRFLAISIVRITPTPLYVDIPNCFQKSKVFNLFSSRKSGETQCQVLRDRADPICSIADQGTHQ